MNVDVCATVLGVTLVKYDKPSGSYKITLWNLFKMCLSLILFSCLFVIAPQCADTSAKPRLLTTVNCMQIFIWFALLAVDFLNQMLMARRLMKALNELLLMDPRHPKCFNWILLYVTFHISCTYIAYVKFDCTVSDVFRTFPYYASVYHLTVSSIYQISLFSTIHQLFPTHFSDLNQDILENVHQKVVIAGKFVKIFSISIITKLLLTMEIFSVATFLAISYFGYNDSDRYGASTLVYIV